MTNVDRIATVALGATPHVVGGTELRLFDRGPYGTQPTALALSRDGSRLYVALTGLDAVAVIDARDPLHMHRLGLHPDRLGAERRWRWPPTIARSTSRTRRVRARHRFHRQPATGADARAVWSTLQRIDLAQVKLADTTRAALGAARNVVAVPPPLPNAIRNVVLIVEGAKNYDEVLGDLGSGPGAPSFTLFGAADTPNLHALARRFGLAGNIFADPGGSAQQVIAGGLASAFTDRTAGVRDGRKPLGYANQDPEDALRLGTVFHELARHDLSFRDYGGLLEVSGTTPSGYTQNVPAPAVLAGHVDTDYPGWNDRRPDALRAAEFVRDYGALEVRHQLPRFAYVTLPAGPDDAAPAVPPAAAVADGDRALGTIVEFLSHLPSWRTTVVFVVPAGARTGRDHVDASRTFALVVSPYAKRGYIGMRHLSTASVLKTVDRLFALPPLSLGDLLASDMGDFFGTQPDVHPYVAAAAGTPAGR